MASKPQGSLTRQEAPQQMLVDCILDKEQNAACRVASQDRTSFEQYKTAEMIKASQDQAATEGQELGQQLLDIYKKIHS
jgi:hypothetical protein